jgi:hypothetical protein
VKTVATDKQHAISSGVFLLGLGAGIFGTFCPSLYDISSPRFTDKETADAAVKRLRMGEVLASTVTLTVGAALSVIHGSLVPFFVAVFLSAAFLAAYEYMLNWQG